jgi:hypothetical protein
VTKRFPAIYGLHDRSRKLDRAIQHMFAACQHLQRQRNIPSRQYRCRERAHALGVDHLAIHYAAQQLTCPESRRVLARGDRVALVDEPAR